MYDVHVTNKSDQNIYLRLKPRELSSSNASFNKELHAMVKTAGGIDELRSSEIHAFLVQCGFHLIPPQRTQSFATGNVPLSSNHQGSHMYLSLYAESVLWIMDDEADFRNFSCLFVKRDPRNVNPRYSSFTYSAVNPEPLWVTANCYGPFPPNTIKISSSPLEKCFGRSPNGLPCAVISWLPPYSVQMCQSWIEGSGMSYTQGDILIDTGHQFYRVKRGDPVPLNAVIVGTSNTEGVLYLGRVGTIPCSISTEDGKIKKFFYSTFNLISESANGEILVLTSDASPNF